MSFLVVIGIAVGLAMDAFAVAVGASVSLGRITGRQIFRFAFHFGLFQAAMPIVGWLAGRGLNVYIAAWDHWLAFALLAAIGAKAIVSALRNTTTDADRADVGRVALGPPNPRRGHTCPEERRAEGSTCAEDRRAEGDPPYNTASPRPFSDDDTTTQHTTYWPGPGDVPPPEKDPTRGFSLLMLSVATSIDALAVGVTFGVLQTGSGAIWLAVLIIGLVTAALTTLGMHLGARLGALMSARHPTAFPRITEILGGLVLIAIGIKILVEHLG